MSQEIIELSGVKLAINQAWSPIIQNSVRSGRYEKREIELIDEFLEENDCVMELGAGIGFVSSYCAKKIGSQNVFTYEGNSSLKVDIESTYALNNVSPQVSFCILGDSVDKKIFYLEKDFWISSTIPVTKKSTPTKVPQRKINRELDLIKPTFLIIDIEGENAIC